MRLVTFQQGSECRVGALIHNDEHVVDLQAAFHQERGNALAAFASMQSLIEAGQEALAIATDLIGVGEPRFELQISQVKLLAPLPRPLQIRDALCFKAHLVNAIERYRRDTGAAEYTPQQKQTLELFGTRPFWYKANRLSVVGTDAEVYWPSYSKVMDYELEMGMVLGRGGRNIPLSTAADHIFGYTIFNDFSARDVQGPEMASLGPTKSKDFDGGNVFGPCIVTADEFDPADVGMSVRINDEIVSAGRSGTMHYSFAELIAYISQDETLYPGEIICSGTVGMGSGLETGRYLSHGDIVELSIDGIGKLRNRVFAADSGGETTVS